MDISSLRMANICIGVSYCRVGAGGANEWYGVHSREWTRELTIECSSSARRGNENFLNEVFPVSNRTTRDRGRTVRQENAGRDNSFAATV